MSVPALAPPIPAPADPWAGLRRIVGTPAPVLFLSLFASQAGVLVLSPILVDVARDFGVSTSLAGQLRIVAAPLAAAVAVAVARWGAGVQLRRLLLAGTALLALGSLASAAAPSFALLALAQVPIWTGSAALVAAGIAGAAAWSAPDQRTRVVARALAGPPAAWIVGMPVIGLVAEVHWRLAFLALPLPAAVFAGLALALREPDAASDRGARASFSALLREPNAMRWALGELLANAAWVGTLVYVGALLVEVHGTSSLTTGLVLAAVAVAYLLGNLRGGRLADGSARGAIIRGDLAAAAALAATWMTPNLATTFVLLCVAAYIAAARTVAGTSYGFVVGPNRTLEVGAVRSVTTQLGYLVGSVLGGLALAVGGYAAVGLVFAALFAGAAIPYACLRRDSCARRAVLAT